MLVMRARGSAVAAAIIALGAAAVIAPLAGGTAAAASPHGCVAAPIHHDAPPTWTAPAWAGSSAGFRPRYSLASGDGAAAFWWEPRLHAGDPSNPANKVLWVMRYPRNGTALRIVARWGADPAVSVRRSWPPDASPGEIYPSYVNLPRAGCWELTLSWSSHVARLDVQVYR
jgi:hypothetical protein